MKKLIKYLIIVAIILLIIIGIYKIFFACEHSYTNFEREFTLKKPMDYATVSEEAIVKLIKVTKSDSCHEEKEKCLKKGEATVKVLVVNDHRVSYVTLDTLIEKSKDLEKLDYMIELIEVTENEEVTLKLTNLKKEEK